jgi:hypothetical protein
MRVGITRFFMMAALAALMAFGGSKAAWAQCPASPNYSPDFTSNQNCLTLNGTNAGYPGFFPAVPPPPPGVTTVLRVTPNQTATAGSAWFNSQQPVSGVFSTTFMFQITGGNTDLSPADGIAFVIQNSDAGTSALGPDGCGIGFGGNTCTGGTGITNSLAVEFDTFQNDGDPNNNHVAVQNCSGTAANSTSPSCRLADNFNLNALPTPVTLADGNRHTATITYTPSSLMTCGSNHTATCSSLDVILDGNDLFPGGVLFDLSTITLNNGNAWVGFTASTGGGDNNQDILSWTFTPNAQTAVISTAALTTLPFPNASGTQVYDYNAQLTASYPTPVVQIQPILISQSACNALVQRSFWPAHCFVYENAEDSGIDSSVMFEVTCPLSPGGTCGSGTDQNFFAELGTDFEFLRADNPMFTYPGIFGLLNPFPGWLKGDSGPDPLHPCTPPATGPLFQSNQIDTFFIDNGTTKGKGNGGASCWVTTYDTPGEALPGIKISSPKFTTYTKGQSVTASYSCTNPFTSKPANNPTGPYLTDATCTQKPGTQTSCTQTGNGFACTGSVDTSTRGLHTFTVTAIDSGGNTNVNAVVYNVK